MADTRLSDLASASALSASDLFYVVQSAGSGGEKATGTQLLTLVGTTYVPLAGGTMTGALTIASGTLTASAPALNITQTWNEGATTFTALSVAVTNTASGGGYLADFRVGGIMQFNVDRGGGMYWGAASGGAADANYVYTKSLALTNGSTRYAVDALLTRDAAATLAQRNGTTAQIFRVYNTYTDASNYERASIGWASNLLTIGVEKLGTGSDRSLQIATGTLSQIYFAVGSTVRWILNSSGSGNDFSPNSNNAVDLGVTGSRVRSLYLGTSLMISGNGSYVQTPSMTVANLAAAATAGAGARAFVTDANATTFLSTVAAGGANKVPVVSDGTNWLIG